MLRLRQPAYIALFMKPGVMKPSVLLTLQLALVGSAVLGGCGSLAAGAVRGPRAQTLRLCAPAGTPLQTLTLARRIVASRLREEIGPQAPAVVLEGAQQCVVVRFRRHISGIHALAGVLAEQGVFVQGIGVPPSPSGPDMGTRVRYITDPVTTANQSLPVVRPIFGSGDIRRPSVVLRVHLVSFHLKPGTRRMWCRFTASHSGDILPTLFDRVVLNSWLVPRGTCNGVVTPYGLSSGGFFRPRNSRLGAKALFAYLRFGPLPFQWRRVTVSS
jgi:hypothetical protein